MQELLVTSCVCGGQAVEVVGRKDDRTVGRCIQCGLMRTVERAVHYTELYTEGDRYHIDRNGHTPYRERYDHDFGIAAVRWPKLIKRFRLLDVGCANGAFLKYAQRMGMDVEGLELNPGMAAWARQKTGLVVHTDWHTVEVGQFDVVTLHDVFEHVDDPRAELHKVTKYLRPAGVIVIDVPDAGHEDFTKDPMGSHHMKPLEHLWHWTEAHLVPFIESCGLTVSAVDRPIPGKLVVYARVRA